MGGTMDRKPILVFDFDWTLIDCNSDPWVVDKLGMLDLMNELLKTLPWTALMDRMMGELHSAGRTIEDINSCLKLVPLHTSMQRTVRLAAELGCDLQILSDANSHFIGMVLENYGLRKYFSKIHTNPAHVDQSGILRIFPYHPSELMPHGCTLCPVNMCKGTILDDLRYKVAINRQRCVIYLGDGKGDYCPSLRLHERDHILARQGFPLLKLLQENPRHVKAQVHPWSSAEDVENILTAFFEA